MMKKIIILFVLVLIFTFPFKSFAYVTASTGQAISVTTTGATLNGSLTNDQPGIGATGYFQYSQNNTSSCNLMVNPITTGFTTIFNPPAGVNTFPMTTTLGQLQPNTTYYFCAVGLNNSPYPTYYGSVSSFHTASLPSSGGGSSSNAGTIGTVTTANAFNITDQEASFKGTVSSTTGTSYGYFRYTSTKVPPVFCNDIYGSDMTSVTASLPNASGQVVSGNFYASVENLEEDTEYYYCAVVSNTSLDPNSNKLWVPTNIKYGQVKSFHTLPCATCPHTTITTEPANNIKSTSAKINGSYFSTKTVTTHFEYKKASLLANPGSSLDPNGTVTNNQTQSSWISVGSSQHNVNASTNFNSVYGGLSYNLTGLLPDTLYNFRLVGVTSNPTETFYGNTVNFVTHKYEGVGPLGNSNGDTTGGGTTGTGTNSTTCPTGYTGTPPNCTLTNANGPLPTITVTANPPTIATAGGTSTVSWTSTNTTSCATDVSAGGGVGGGGASGSFGTGPITSGHSYSVTCTGPNGSVSDTVYVYVMFNTNTNSCSSLGLTGTYPECTNPTTGNPVTTCAELGQTGTWPNCSGTNNTFPSVFMTASPSQINPGGSSTISWEAHNVNVGGCNTNGNGIPQGNTNPNGTHAEGFHGSFTVSPTHDQSYSVSCQGQNGSASDTVSVYVNTSGSTGSQSQYPFVSITASPMVITPGQTTTIAWTSSIHLLDSCVASEYPGLSNSQNSGLSGSFPVNNLTNDHSYSVTCTGPNGSVSDSVIVYVNNSTSTCPIGWTGTPATGCINPNAITCPAGWTGTPTTGCVNPNLDTNGINLPTISVSASPILVPVNGVSTISWTAHNVTSCVTGTSENGTSGSFGTDPLPASHSYSVTCSGQNGSVSDSVFVLVNQIYEYPGDDGNPGDDTPTPPITGTCPVGWTGTPTTGCINPNTTSGSTCPTGWTGTPTTGCTNPTSNECPTGWTGTPTTGCINPNTTSGSTCPAGWTGTPTTGCTSPNYWPACGIGTADLDCDGIINFFDTDTDGDSWPNNVDLDDDGDGIPDLIDSNPNGNGNPTDYDNGGIPNIYDSDIDGDGVPNIIDTDTDGDGIPNIYDFDDDGDGIPDLIDSTPTGIGTIDDYDGGGTPNTNDSDIDGDGVPNESDPDTDGDGVPNTTDQDDDNDGIPDGTDTTPTGINSLTGPILHIGDIAFPAFDDIVHYHEGIEHVFIRRIMKSAIFQNKYGYQTGSSLQIFAWNLAHLFAKDFGYVNSAGQEIRVSKPDVSAYALRLSGNKLTVYEYYKNKIIDIRNTTNQFKSKNPYEYYFKKN